MDARRRCSDPRGGRGKPQSQAQAGRKQVVRSRLRANRFLGTATKVYAERPVPVILVSAYSDAKLIERAEADHIMAYLVKPIKQTDLEPAIGLAMRRFEQFEALRREAADIRQALEDRKIIERAKGILMKELDLSEAEAFRRLQKTASAKNLKLIELARLTLAMSKAAPSS
jgi:response regulator NasT